MKTCDVIEYFGTVTAVADVLNMAQPSVSRWGVRPPVLRQLQIEALTQGALQAHEECDPFRVPATAQS